MTARLEELGARKGRREATAVLLTDAEVIVVGASAGNGVRCRALDNRRFASTKPIRHRAPKWRLADG